MNKFLKLSQYAGICFSMFLFSCSEDKGNYDYTEKQVITIDGIPESISVESELDYIDFKPTVTSAIDGELTEENENYTFLYQKKNSEGKWVDVEEGKDIYQLAKLPTGSHPFVFSVTDNRTGVKALKLFMVDAKTSTSEGWMVLCNVGAEKQARMDMLTQIDLDRIFPKHDVLVYANESLKLTDAKKIGFSSSQTKNRNRIVMMAGNGSYLLPTSDDQCYKEFVKVTGVNDFKKNLFMSKVDDNIVNFVTVPANIWKPDHDAQLCVSDAGNVYACNTKETMTAFESAINTSKRGDDPEYKVAPFIGVSLSRNLGSRYGAALLFDTDNHRFIGWHGVSEPAKQTCYPLEDPAPAEKKFSFQTGSMDLVSMVNTNLSEGLVYCIMQDGSNRHIYAINLADDTFKQFGAYLNLNLPNFDKATLFAASSQFSVIYYAYKNVVYAYNYLTKSCVEALTLPAGEEVTMIKFDRIDHPWGVSGLLDGKPQADVKTELFLKRENQLIVGSFNAAEGDNGGMLRFYNTDKNGMELNLHKDKLSDGKDRTWEFDGYGQIVDIKYKEVR